MPVLIYAANAYVPSFSLHTNGGGGGGGSPIYKTTLLPGREARINFLLIIFAPETSA